MTELEADPVRVAIQTLLKEDPVLKALATGGVFFQLAPQEPEAPTPYVIFENPDGTDEWCFDGEAMEEGEITVKGIGTPKQAESIDRRCRDLLNSEELSIDGYELLFVRSTSKISYPEYSDGERFQHTGHNYKLIVEKEE